MVLTNHHVVFDEPNGSTPASAVQVAFQYELGIDGQPLVPQTFTALPGTLKGGDPGADWAVITFDESLPDAAPILANDGPAQPVAADDRVVIIQHPKGMHKKVALAHNLARFTNGEVIQYWTDTESGSSGGACLQ